MSYNSEIIGWMLVNELKTIEKLAQTVPENGLIVEVGSFMGRSSYCWATSSHPSVRVICIDTYHQNYNVTHNISEDICAINNFPKSKFTYNIKEEFIKNVGHLSNISMIEGYSPNINYSGDLIDIFFLDAEHKNPNDWNNIEFFLPYIKKGGLLCGHDYGSEFPDILSNIELLEAKLNQSVQLYAGTRIWSFRV